MRKIEILTIGFLLGAVPIIICFLAGWWISIPFVPESRIILFALAGSFVGVIIDILFLKMWIQTAYSMKPIVWMMIYLFYSFGMFGFFMGVPVFNVALALPAGFFIGGWLIYKGADSIRMKKAARNSAIFTTSVLAFICAASATIALVSFSTTSDLQGMFGLQITPAMIIGVILGGGIFLLILQWWLTFWSVVLAYKYFNTRVSS
ncbi:MAG: hypothetical protein NTX22_04115 [Ignavibacteriales bacterium]|nr:hypothetical protein [Ignavibacteriales bacterium]